MSADLHLIRGTFRADRHAGDATPTPPTGEPTPPHPLTGHAKAEWDRMVGRLAANRTLSVVDDAALYQYVQLFDETETVREDSARLRKLSRALMRLATKLQGPELVEALGKIAALEQLSARHATRLRQGHLAIRQFLVEFGMTPSARTKVKTLGGGVEAPQSKAESFRQSKQRDW